MQRSSFPWLWVALAAFLLLIPGPAGRILLDLIGGVTLLVLLLPLLATGVGIVAWQLLRRRLTTCQNCGTTSFGSDLCPGCGAPLRDLGEDIGTEDPSRATINVESVDVDPSP